MVLQIAYILVGALTGAIVGCSGVGGAAIMTPILILLGVNPVTAVGTDLIFSFVTKVLAIKNYHAQRNVDWAVVKRLCLGSIPASIAVLSILFWVHDTAKIDHFLKPVLGYVLLLVAFILMLKTLQEMHFQKSTKNKSWAFTNWIRKHQATFTILSGIILGSIVTLTSIGAGSIGVVLIYALYHRLPTLKIIGTDLAQALFITFVASIGHGIEGHINYTLLFFLLLGSVPAVLTSSYYARYLPEKFIRMVLIIVLLITGIRFISH